MEVSPFRGIRYSQSIVGDLGRVICPPYDVITSEQQRLYYRLSDYNAIRLECTEPTSDRYQRSARIFQLWMRQGVLQRDDVSSFYLHDHRFEHAGRRMVRRGVIARVKVQAWGRGIFPHEETSSRAKSDRLELMRACRANFSPVLSLYHDSERKLAAILSCVAKKEPIMSLRTGQGTAPDRVEAHSLWAIGDEETKSEIGKLLSSELMYIADGHHRYEAAIAYRDERIQQQLGGRKSSGNDFESVMMELVDFSDDGLVVLPVHRLVRGIAPSKLIELEDQLGKFFAVEPIPLGADSWELTSGSCVGVLGLRPASLSVLKKRPDVSFEAMMPDNRSGSYQQLGVSILNHVILDRILEGAGDLDIAYTRDAKEAHRLITEGKYQLAFVLHSPKPEIVKLIVDANDRMPTKSTYFYPKSPAGLVMNSLD